MVKIVRRPNLGYATTDELINELRARAEVDHAVGDISDNAFGVVRSSLNCLKSRMNLDYKTVGEE